MKTRRSTIWLVIGILVLNILVSGLVSYVVANPQNSFESFYTVETDVMVSPHGLRKKMAKGEASFTLVDLRSAEEYAEGHIVGAVNIPAYSSRDHSAYDEVERIVSSFSELDFTNDVIVYCYSMPCMTGRKVGKMLADRGIYVRELGVGWNEWRHHWKLWNHEHEWNVTSVEDYIAVGHEPGTFKIEGGSFNPCGESEYFDC